MEQDQVLKRLEWLDDERRKDKDVIARQENRIATMEGSIKAAHQQIKELTSEIARLTAVVKRMDDYDSAMLQVRVETNRQIEELDKQTRKREDEIEKVRRVEIRSLEADLEGFRRQLEPIDGLRRGLQARVEGEMRLEKQDDEQRLKIQDLQRNIEETLRFYRLVEETQRQDVKKISDLQGETAALRKRMDEQRGQNEVISAASRKVEARLNEVLALESERKDSQSAFMEKLAMQRTELDRILKDWQVRIETLDNQATEVQNQLQAIEASFRVTKRLQESVEELSQRVERRSNEITEIQRLSEERFRQEWVTFKADDQKRWTNYTLTQEEQRSETSKSLNKLTNQVGNLKDNIDEINDAFQQVNQETEARLQALLSLAHEWVAASERISTGK
jgi:chromosome segregation ATPase